MMIVLGVVILILSGAILLLLRQIWIMQFPWGDNRIEDVTPLDIPLFDGAQEVNQRLENLGFKPLAVAKVWLFWRRNQPAYVWYYVNDSKNTYAEVSAYQSKTDNALVGLFSWFLDNSLVETLYPIGENIDTSNYVAHFVKEDLEGGYARHQETVKSWLNTHGSPIPIQNLTQLKSYDVLDIKLYRRRRYRRLTIYSMVFIALSAVSIYFLTKAIEIEFTVGLGTDVFQMAYNLATQATLLLVCFVAMGVLTYLLQHPRGALDSKRKPKPFNDV